MRVLERSGHAAAWDAADAYPAEERFLWHLVVAAALEAGQQSHLARRTLERHGVFPLPSWTLRRPYDCWLLLRAAPLHPTLALEAAARLPADDQTRLLDAALAADAPGFAQALADVQEASARTPGAREWTLASAPSPLVQVAAAWAERGDHERAMTVADRLPSDDRFAALILIARLLVPEGGARLAACLDRLKSMCKWGAEWEKRVEHMAALADLLRHVDPSAARRLLARALLELEEEQYGRPRAALFAAVLRGLLDLGASHATPFLQRLWRGLTIQGDAPAEMVALAEAVPYLASAGHRRWASRFSRRAAWLARSHAVVVRTRPVSFRPTTVERARVAAALARSGRRRRSRLLLSMAFRSLLDWDNVRDHLHSLLLALAHTGWRKLPRRLARLAGLLAVARFRDAGDSGALMSAADVFRSRGFRRDAARLLQAAATRGDIDEAMALPVLDWLVDLGCSTQARRMARRLSAGTLRRVLTREAARLAEAGDLRLLAALVRNPLRPLDASLLESVISRLGRRGCLRLARAIARTVKSPHLLAVSLGAAAARWLPSDPARALRVCSRALAASTPVSAPSDEIVVLVGRACVRAGECGWAEVLLRRLPPGNRADDILVEMSARAAVLHGPGEAARVAACSPSYTFPGLARTAAMSALLAAGRAGEAWELAVSAPESEGRDVFIAGFVAEAAARGQIPDLTQALTLLEERLPADLGPEMTAFVHVGLLEIRWARGEDLELAPVLFRLARLSDDARAAVLPRLLRALRSLGRVSDVLDILASDRSVRGQWVSAEKLLVLLAHLAAAARHEGRTPLADSALLELDALAGQTHLTLPALLALQDAALEDEAARRLEPLLASSWDFTPSTTHPLRALLQARSGRRALLLAAGHAHPFTPSTSLVVELARVHEADFSEALSGIVDPEACAALVERALRARDWAGALRFMAARRPTPESAWRLLAALAFVEPTLAGSVARRLR